MKTIFRNSLLGFALISLTFLSSCLDDGLELSDQDSQNIENEAATDGYFEDAEDMATLAVAVAPESAGGRIASFGKVSGTKPIDIRFGECVTVTLEMAEDTQPGNPHGYITINFGEGCTDLHGNTRKGIIVVEFKGKSFFPGSKIITTFDGYHINGVRIEGTRTVTNVTGSTSNAPKFEIVLEDGRATWPDETFATREGSHTREWIRESNPLQDSWIVEGSGTGSNRNGASYQLEITKPLVYKRECAIGNKVFMAVEGTKVLTVGNHTITIDYGTGECDRIVTITINGQSRSVIVRGGE
ncbi:MAG: hypothetical protein E6Q41_01170 [Cyclobacteriaceae bacterium]|nr:MAG: hypothetical protein E6Q41_01170 [Cyclobacteriaceae bacterium]